MLHVLLQEAHLLTLFTQKMSEVLILIHLKWLQVLGTAELSQISQRVRHHLHARVPLLDTRATPQEPLALLCPRQGRSSWARHAWMASVHHC
jgi:hypothetical protein